MTIQSNIGAPTGAADPGDITLSGFLETLWHFGPRPVVFRFDAAEVRPVCQVTEVRAGQFRALDCGGNPEARLPFEVGDKVRPMQLFRAVVPVVTDGVARIVLRRVPQAASRAIAGRCRSNPLAAFRVPSAAEPAALLPWRFR